MESIQLDGLLAKEHSVLGGVGASAMVTTWSNTTIWSYAQQAYAPASQPTDVVVIQGSATKTIKIQSILISAESSVAGALSASIIRRTTAPTGGTSTTLVGTPHDTLDGLPTATVKFFSANPTVGTIYGTGNGSLGCQQLICGNNGSIPAQEVIWSFEMFGVKPIILRGVNEYICINLGGTTYPALASMKLDIEIDIEEDNSTTGG